MPCILPVQGVSANTADNRKSLVGSLDSKLPRIGVPITKIPPDLFEAAILQAILQSESPKLPFRSVLGGADNEGGPTCKIPLGENLRNQSWFVIRRRQRRIRRRRRRRRGRRRSRRRRRRTRKSLTTATLPFVIAARIQWVNLLLGVLILRGLRFTLPPPKKCKQSRGWLACFHFHILGSSCGDSLRITTKTYLGPGHRKKAAHVPQRIYLLPYR